MGGNIFIHQVWQTWQQSMTHYDEEKHRNEDRQRQAPSGNPWQEPTGLGHNCCGSQAFGHKDPQSTLAARPCKTCKLLLDFFSGFVWTSRVNCVIGECLSATGEPQIVPGSEKRSDADCIIWVIGDKKTMGSTGKIWKSIDSLFSDNFLQYPAEINSWFLVTYLKRQGQHLNIWLWLLAFCFCAAQMAKSWSKRT